MPRVVLCLVASHSQTTTMSPRPRRAHKVASQAAESWPLGLPTTPLEHLLSEMSQIAFPAKMLASVDSFVVLALFSTKLRASSHNEQFRPTTVVDVDTDVDVLLAAERIKKCLFANSEVTNNELLRAGLAFANTSLDNGWVTKARSWRKQLLLQCIQQFVFISIPFTPADEIPDA
jgi:hypothetical protein